MIDLKNVTISDDNQTFVNNLSVQINGGQITSLMGPSGSGKSTLLAFIAGFLSKHFTATGKVLINDQHILDKPAENRRVGLLFQDDLLLPHLNVAQNLAFGIRPHTVNGKKRNKAQRDDMILGALASAGLDGFAARQPTTLSGGQRARVALLRTLLSEPKALLLDEPFSKLDTNLRQHFRQFVKDEVEKRNLPTLMVTHDMDDAKAMLGPILTLESGGKLRQVKAAA